MTTLRPNKERAKIAILFLWICMGFELVVLFSSYLQYSLLSDFEAGNISVTLADSNDKRELIVAVGQVLLKIVAGIVFIQWFRRAYYNLHTTGEKLSYTEGWAAGAWFVPILNLFRPYQIMMELYQKTKKRLLANNILPFNALNTKTVGIWWAVWITLGIASRVISRLAVNADDIVSLKSLTLAEMVISILAIPLAVIAVKVVKDYADVEHLLQDTMKDESKSSEDEILASFETSETLIEGTDEKESRDESDTDRSNERDAEEPLS